MSNDIKEILLQFAMNELAKPSYNHVLKCISEDLQSKSRVVLVAAAAAAASIPESPTQVEGGTLHFSRKDSYLNSFFSISSESWELLIQDIGMILKEEKCPYISLRDGIFFVIWMLCQTEKTKPPVELANLPISLRYLGKIITALASLSSDRIYWPTQLQCREIAEDFETNYGFPGVVGVLATSKLPIILTENIVCDVGKIHVIEDFYDSTLNCSAVTLQVVVNHCGSMIDVCVGLPGSWSPLKVLRSSRLYSRLVCNDKEEEYLLMSDGYHLLAGPEYPQFPTLITPYDIKFTEISPTKSCFNRMHGRALNSGKIALSNFLDKYPRLKRLNTNDKWNPTREEFHLGEDICHSAAVVTLAACVLHNATLNSQE